MENLMTFFTIIAWVAGIVSTILLGVCSYLTIKYPGSVDEIMDKLQGVKRSYPIWPWMIIAVISWAFIIAF